MKYAISQAPDVHQPTSHCPRSLPRECAPWLGSASLGPGDAGPVLTSGTIPSAPWAVEEPQMGELGVSHLLCFLFLVCTWVRSITTLGDDICPGQMLSYNLASSSFMSPRGHNPSL